MKKYDSKNDTRKHIKRVAHYLAICKKELARKAKLHDFDKIHDKTEKAMFCGGFLKTFDYKEAWRLAWDKASKEEHLKMLELPNWDNEVFKEISGIDAETEIAKEVRNEK